MPTSISYEEFVEKGNLLNPDTTRERLLLGCIGLAGESGEVIDELKKHIFHNKDLCVDDIVEEIGDVFWYLTLLLNEFDYTIEEVLEINKKKLLNRYPEIYG